MKKKIQIGALISGGGSNLQAIIDGCASGAIDGEMAFVGSDNKDASGLQRASRQGIPSFCVDYSWIIHQCKVSPGALSLPDDFDMDETLGKQSLFPERKDFEKARTFMAVRAIAEAALLEKITAYSFDLIVLAGFMRTLSPYFIDRVNVDPAMPRIMNIHPALLPSFPGVDGYGDTFRYGCKVAGCTVHFIDYGEDSGPLIGQRAFAILPDDSIDTIKKRGLALEWELYPECIQLFAHNRLEMVYVPHTTNPDQSGHRAVIKIKPPISL
jgi:phosphoribosylglycinamide formyltransferase 1